MNMGDSEASKTNCIIDHIVLLVSTEDFEAPPPWLSDNFTILDGGNHEGMFQLIILSQGRAGSLSFKAKQVVTSSLCSKMELI